MFEPYTEIARRVIFFARYEADQFGSPYHGWMGFPVGLLRSKLNPMQQPGGAPMTNVSAVLNHLEHDVTGLLMKLLMKWNVWTEP